MFRIISCNIRKSDADDRENSWRCRRVICCAVIHSRAPDIICFQEMRRDQFTDLSAFFPRYAAYGLTKGAGDANPINTIFYDPSRFGLLAAGGFWLSDTPQQPGSSSWGSASIRLANWVQLQEEGTGKVFQLLNTHLDHGSEPARVNQAQVIVHEMKATRKDDSVQIVTGDLNAGWSHPAMVHFREAGFRDTYEEAHGFQYGGNTFHNFAGERYQGREGKIDWILTRGTIKVIQAAIVRDAVHSCFPSDHYLVEATLELY
jgi:endonuclease/exonuclease/phosphatase family metal-dependent hydrolase